jgi:hypothetical protein
VLIFNKKNFFFFFCTGPVKRARKGTDREGPASKQQKTENGAGDQ